jgi:transposase-like protein
LNSSGVRDISRILKISRNTFSSELKKTWKTSIINDGRGMLWINVQALL